MIEQEDLELCALALRSTPLFKRPFEDEITRFVSQL
jgi:hypothetical protein